MPRKQLYYPKSSVSKPMIALPGEFVDAETNEQYVGSYVTANGLILSGPTPSESSRFLKSTIDAKNFKRTQENTSQYFKLTEKDFSNHTPPSIYFPTPSIKDYQTGQFKRYFCQKKNEKDVIIEISKEMAGDANKNNKIGIDLGLYDVFEVQWMLKGKDALSINTKNVNFLERDYPGVIVYLNNLRQFISSTQKFQRYYPDNKEISANLPSAYGLPKIQNQNCTGCVFYKQHYCSRWQAQVRHNYWCASFKYLWNGLGHRFSYYQNK